MLPLVIQALPKWDSAYASTAFTLAKWLSVKRLVVYVEHPFTWKDIWKGHAAAQISRRKAVWEQQRTWEQPLPDYPNLIAVYPKPIFPDNSLPNGFIYKQLHDINQRSIVRDTQLALRHFGIKDYVYLNSFDPVFDQLGQGAKAKIYHCVDNMAGERYIARHGVAAEERVARKANLVVATSPALRDKMSQFNRNAYLVANAADYQLFSQNVNTIPEELARIPTPRLVYTGNLGLRIDYSLLEAAAQQRPDWQFVFIGPIDPREFKGQSLQKLPNAHFLGAKPIEQLPAYLAGAQACLIPFVCDDLTRFIYPLKINEYLAAGKPVVLSPFANFEGFEEVIHLYKDLPTFLSACQTALSANSPEESEARRAVAANNTWEKRAEQLENLMGQFE